VWLAASAVCVCVVIFVGGDVRYGARQREQEAQGVKTSFVCGASLEPLRLNNYVTSRIRAQCASAVLTCHEAWLREDTGPISNKKTFLAAPGRSSDLKGGRNNLMTSSSKKYNG
jgi:hypothetical protein